MKLRMELRCVHGSLTHHNTCSFMEPLKVLFLLSAVVAWNCCLGTSKFTMWTFLSQVTDNR